MRAVMSSGTGDCTIKLPDNWSNHIDVWTRVTTTRWEDCVDGGSNYEPIRYFNCKRCGAVGQSGVCEYCGSAEE